MNEQSFIAYWDELDAELRKLFGTDTGDAGIEPDTIAAAQEQGDTPEAFALWFGEKYGLAPLAEIRADWCRNS